MNKEEIKIITLGDIFRNLETEEQAFEFLKYIKNLQHENQKYKKVIDKAIEYINHFSKESEVKIYGLPKCKVFIGDIEQLLEILKEVE